MEKDEKPVKVQKSIHFSTRVFQTIAERAKINHRTISGEVEYMLLKQIDYEAQNNLRALAMASKPPTD